MKKIFALLLTISMLLGSMLLLSGCSARVRYDNADAYTAAEGSFEIEEEIHSVEIYWEGKYVSVSGAFVNKVKAQEDHETADNKAMHYLVEDGVLKIYPCASGKKVADLAKSLFLELPMDIANSLQKLEIKGKGDTTVYLQMMKPTELLVTTEDGSVNFDGELNRAHVETEKGNFVAKSVSLSDLEFVSEVGNVNISLHLYGFTAVMLNEKGTFVSDYEETQNGNIYSYGTQEPSLIFDTEGVVNLQEYKILR